MSVAIKEKDEAVLKPVIRDNQSMTCDLCPALL